MAKVGGEMGEFDDGAPNYHQQLKQRRLEKKQKEREAAIIVLKKCLEFAESKLKYNDKGLKEYLRGLPEDDIYEVRFAFHYAENKKALDAIERESILLINRITLKWLRNMYDLRKVEVQENDRAYLRVRMGKMQQEIPTKIPCPICGKRLKDPESISHINSEFHQDALKLAENKK